MNAKNVVCFGSSRTQEGSPEWELAERTGELLGARGLTVVSGGYDGSMGAVSRGAHRAGGRVVGITTPIFADRDANEHVHEERVEADYPARLAALLRAGDGFITFPGALGTLSEWTTAWCLATIGQLGGPLWLFRAPWDPLSRAALSLAEVDDRHAGHLRWVDGVEDLRAELDRWLER